MHPNTNKARKLRQNLTEQEAVMWHFLRNRGVNGFKFRRQYPIGNYVVDFVCRELKLIIELDGGQHNEPTNIEYDQKRTQYLNEKGYRVIRFWNNDIDENLEGVYQSILKALD